MDMKSVFLILTVLFAGPACASAQDDLQSRFQKALQTELGISDEIPQPAPVPERGAVFRPK